MSAESSDRVERARLSLDGLSIGDGFGQQFFYEHVLDSARPGNLPIGPWKYTDDTEMALAVVEVLEQYGTVDQDALAQRFVERYRREPNRGYGAGARRLLEDIASGERWSVAVQKMFSGSGSYGNGAAMRVAPLGAWFADDVDQTIAQATLSADVTHFHSEGRIGAIAVALAAGWASRRHRDGSQADPAELVPWVIEHIDDSEVRRRLEWTNSYDLDTWPYTIASQVGCGLEISAQDTVPFCIWLAASRLDDFCDAMWTTARVGGDVDTTCAIVGGIVAASVGRGGIPEEWRLHREPLH